MTFNELENELKKGKADLFLRWHDTPTMAKVLKMLYKYGFNFVCRPNLNTAHPLHELKAEKETAFYSYYHGNSKPILHIFYNDITGKNDIQYTTESITKTYPQYKKAKFYNIW